MKREITFCSAPFFRVLSRCFPKRRKVVSWRRFSFFFLYSERGKRTERTHTKQDGQERKEERMGTKAEGREKRMEGREGGKEKEETHLLLSFSLLQNLRKGNMLPAQKEKNVSLLLFLFLFCLCSLNSAALTSSFASLQTTGATTLLPIRLYMHSTWTGPKRKRQFLF